MSPRWDGARVCRLEKTDNRVCGSGAETQLGSQSLNGFGYEQACPSGPREYCVSKVGNRMRDDCKNCVSKIIKH